MTVLGNIQPELPKGNWHEGNPEPPVKLASDPQSGQALRVSIQTFLGRFSFLSQLSGPWVFSPTLVPSPTLPIQFAPPGLGTGPGTPGRGGLCILSAVPATAFLPSRLDGCGLGDVGCLLLAIVLRTARHLEELG